MWSEFATLTPVLQRRDLLLWKQWTLLCIFVRNFLSIIKLQKQNQSINANLSKLSEPP